MKEMWKNILYAFLIFLLLAGIFSIFNNPVSGKEVKKISFSKLVEQIKNEKVKEITVEETKVNVELEDGTKEKTNKQKGVALESILEVYGVSEKKLVEANISSTGSQGENWMILLNIIPFLLIILFFWWILRQSKQGANQAFSFGKANKQSYRVERKQKVGFKDIADMEEAKQEVKEVVDFLKNPRKFLKMGARIPRGVLLVGQPGTGKTLLSRAVASEANVPFFTISGSEFVEMFVGVGASITGDTPVLIKTQGRTKLLPISEFTDQFYRENEEGLKKIEGVQTLGANWSKGNKFFKSSGWKKVKSVHRHKVNEIYEIQFLGEKIRVTGDHSIFVREKNRIVSKKAEQLKEGDILVNLPFKARGSFIPGKGTTHKIKSHEFEKETIPEELSIWNENSQLERLQLDYQFVLANKGVVSQYELARQVGVSQATVGVWQRKVNKPRYLGIASNYKEKGIPQSVKITPSLLKLLGYYTAEGRKTDYSLQFVFGAHENKVSQDCITLMKEVFGIEPHLVFTKDNALRVTYHSKYLAEFFERHCGNGSHNKRIPEFLWSLSKEYFLNYLKGYAEGDGYTSNDKKLTMASVSKQLIIELAWLSAMHGIQGSIRKAVYEGGRIIKNKPLPEGSYWLFKIGKTSHPFLEKQKSPSQIKKPVIKKIIKRPYNDYVYDLCGCENEAFFGGEKPILLHNSRVRDLFNTAKKNAPSIIFLDELDAIGRSRGSGIGGGHDEKEQTLNQILSEMDGFERDTGVIVLAATNRPDTLDPALLRPGRFDRRIIFELPDIKGREEILAIHAKKKPKTSDVKLREIAERTPGFSGADLDNLVNEAAILAARRNKKKISQKEFIESIEKVILGPQRKSHILNENEKKIAAYHEAGHALVSSFTPETETVRKVSIVSRGMAAGYTLKLPVEEKYLKNKTQFKSELATLLGGYTAENIVFNEVTTGASDDLKNATKLSQKLVMEYGMSKLGPITFGKKEDLIFLGKEITEERNFSEEVAKKIDKEVDRFIKEAADKAKSVLEEKRDVLDKLAQKLIEKETVERDEFEKLIGKKTEEKKSTSATRKTTKQNRTKSNKEPSKNKTRNRKSSRQSGES